MSPAEPTPRISRRPFVQELLAAVPDALVISALGGPSYDVFAAGDRDGNFYLWGAMGAAVPVGLGLAIAQPEHAVVVVTGDGEMLMGIGSLATVGAQQPANLAIVVLDNGHYGETGMQRSHTSLGADLSGIAKASGIADSHRITDPAKAQWIASRVAARSGPTFVQVLIEADEPARALPPRDGAFLKNRFRAALGMQPL